GSTERQRHGRLRGLVLTRVAPRRRSVPKEQVGSPRLSPLDARGHVLVPGRPDERIPRVDGGELVRRDPRRGEPPVGGIAEAEAVRQGDVAALHRAPHLPPPRRTTRAGSPGARGPGGPRPGPPRRGGGGAARPAGPSPARSGRG